MLAGRSFLGGGLQWRVHLRLRSRETCRPRRPGSSRTRSGWRRTSVIGMASSAPAATIGLALAALAAATAYGSGPVVVADRGPDADHRERLPPVNMWNANCGASFEWVGRAIDPYLGFLTGWLMVVAYIIGTVAEICCSARRCWRCSAPPPRRLGVESPSAAWSGVVMLVIAVVGIRITARTQVGMALVEYLILIGFAVAGPGRGPAPPPGHVPITRGWFSLSGIDGKGGAMAGFLIAVFVYGGWDGTLYVNEEVKHRRTNPGRAAIIAVGVPGGDLHAGAGGPAGRGVAGEAAGQLGVGAGVRGAGARRRVLGQDDGPVHRAVCDRHDGHRHRVESRIVYGMASYRALPQLPVQRVPALPHPRGGQHRRRRPAHRADLGVPAGDVGRRTRSTT